MKKICILNGSVYDPRQGWQGEKRNIFIEEGIIVDEFPNPDHIIDARGKLVVAAGIDLNTHVATYGLNLARYSFGLPTAKEIGLAYAKMGYLHVNEPLMTIGTATAVHQELSSIPILDSSAFLVLEPRDFWRQFKGNRESEFEEMASFLLFSTRAIGIRVCDLSVFFPENFYRHRNVSTQKVISLLAALNPRRVGKICLPISPRLQEVEVKNASAFHLSQGSIDLHEGEIVNSVFDFLKNGASLDLSLSNGTGVAIFTGRHRKKASQRLLSFGVGLADPIVFAEKHEAQKGLHLARDMLDLRRSGVCFSFCGPPRLSVSPLEKLSDLLVKGVANGGISISEWIEATRSTPALLLGLGMKGHLGIGAQADIAIYDMDPKVPKGPIREKLQTCWVLMKKGTIIIDDFQFLINNVQKDTYYRKAPIVTRKTEPNFRMTFLQQKCLKVDPIFVRNEFGLSSE